MSILSKPLVIGSIATVGFPDLAIFDVPAKIDTGADKSAIWASHIHENDGGLSYILFDEKSEYYTGQIITADTYTVATVKNSFGDSEQRFKVPLVIKIGKKTIKAKFNLADRSNNRFPVLIGKQTLKNKFIVDVSKTEETKKGDKKVLVLTSVHSASANNLVNNLKKNLENKTEVRLLTYSELVFEIKNGKLSVSDINTGQDIKAFDLVYFRTYHKFAEIAGATADYLDSNNIRYLDREVGTYHAKSKLSQYTKLAIAGFSLPDTILMSSEYAKKSYSVFVRKLGSKFIFKDINAERGSNNHLITNKKQFETIQVSSSDVSFVAQQYIPNDFDIRVLVFDKKIALILKRQSASKNTHLHNTSKGGSAKVLPNTFLDEQTQTMCVRAATTLNRQIAGVDLILDKENNKWYILEVNKSPQISSGTFTERKMNKFSKFIKDYIDQ